jgi:hypothetical protein
MPYRHCLKNASLERARVMTKKNGLRANIFLNANESYRGEWLNDRRHGHGVLIDHRHQSMYEGEFVHDRRHGHGRLTVRDADGSMRRAYVGQWYNDQRHGYGTSYINNSSYYEGEYQCDERVGWGRLFYDNGDC